MDNTCTAETSPLTYDRVARAQAADAEFYFYS
jgi:hypothetical protein